MGRKRYQPEPIISKLRAAVVLLAKGDTVGQISRRLGVTEQMYYRWRRDYSGLTVDQAKRLKEVIGHYRLDIKLWTLKTQQEANK